MSFRWVPDTCAYSLNKVVLFWRTQGQRPLSIVGVPAQSPLHKPHARYHFSHRASCPSWKHSQILKTRGRKAWLCKASTHRQRLGLYPCISHISASEFSDSADLNHRMSRLRSTLDSVSKAVSGTQADILAKIAQFKPVQVGKEVKSIHEAPAEEKASGAATTDVSAPLASTAVPPPSVVTVSASIDHEAEEKRQKPPGDSSSKANRNFKKTPRNAVVSSKSAVAFKPAGPLFHPGTFAVNMDDTYNYVAQHINAYFGSATKGTTDTEEKQLQLENGLSQPTTEKPEQNGDHAPVPSASLPATVPQPPNQVSPSPPSPPPSPKKGLSHYLSYSAPVQAFVGNYITPLVPKFRADTKAAVAEKDSATQKIEDTAKDKKVSENKEQKAAEEKAKRLLLQRERIIARVSVDNRTRGLVRALHRATDVRIYINRVEGLNEHLLEFPETRVVAVKEKAIPCLLRLRQATDPALQAAVRQALSLVGYIDPVKGCGIRVLSIDGGGTRGLIAVQTLLRLEALTGKPIYQLFDYICGVSTGAILAFMLAVVRMPLSECEELYRKLGSDVFKQNVIVGTMKMGWSHAFYDSEIWENILKEKLGLDLLVETSRNPDCPKLSAVSTVVNRGTPLKAYVFRNYSIPPGIRSHYRGSCQYKLWQAIRASSAAPGYFKEFGLGGDLHQDGGLLINNPTALAIHECKCLWPKTPLQCVVSLGTGRFETVGKNNATHTSLKTKLTNIISSATDTEEVHTMLDELLPPDTYFRFNPFMPEEIGLDESRSEKLNLLLAEGERYLERNEEKLRKAAGILTQEKSSAQRLADWAKLKVDMYDPVPSSRL
ncbi:calcium-independent phospholipase A2-gamma-like [Clupea harengus]|uniref:Calcium-independent phospholipase A2-gamma-like n=1 Tax=Clupea harengus TaxID=7950 RepID=A0A6P3VE96_CLUHA|nr:calcium-independent phospholipase A2-gamma-like [Clupea harengus]